MCTHVCGLSLQIFKFRFYMYEKFHVWKIVAGKFHFRAEKIEISIHFKYGIFKHEIDISFHEKENCAPGWFYA